MKESISYSFLLNIIITFIFICFAVIMGIFSYYRAFRANSLILNSIEKYEGFNCLSIDEASKGLANLGYHTPFSANRKTDNIGVLQTDSSEFNDSGYSVLLYQDSTSLGSEYQYGVFTYMYMDLPIVNSILKIPVYGKTNVMYEFRDLKPTNNYGMIDWRYIIYASDDEIANYGYHNSISTVPANAAYAGMEDPLWTISSANVLVYASLRGSGVTLASYRNSTKVRAYYKIDVNTDDLLNAQDASPLHKFQNQYTCGKMINYKYYGD